MTNVTILLPPAGLPEQFATYREIFGADRTAAGGPRFTLTVARPPQPPRPLASLAAKRFAAGLAGERPSRGCAAERRSAGAASGAAVAEAWPSAGGLDLLAPADIVVVASGGHEAGAATAAALRAAARRGCRILAVGRAVRTVAATGLLDGRPAAACPDGAEALRDLFPLVRVAVGVRFVDDDPIFTAALDSAAADLCLHVVRKDHGVAAAAAIARSLRRRAAREPRVGPPRVRRRLTDSSSR